MGIRSRLARRSHQRRSARRTLGIESLEQRVVLDGAAGAGFVAVAPYVDSEFGQDPHVESIGPNATQLQLVGGFYASIGSYIDSPNDVDVYQFQATGELLRVNGLSTRQVDFQLFDGVGALVAPMNFLHDEVPTDNGDALLPQEPVDEAGDGFVGCDWGPFDFCDIFPTDPGETYFVTVHGDRVTQYYFDLFHDLSGLDPNGEPQLPNQADSELGDDPHVNQADRAASIIDFTDQATSTIHSFIDEPGDVDVFQFQATARWIHAFAWTGEDLGLQMELIDRTGHVVAGNTVTFIASLGRTIVDPFVDAELEIGQRYFLRVRASGDAVGVYGIDLFQNANVDQITRRPLGAPDSAVGDDPHANEVGSAATNLESEEANGTKKGISTVDTYIDSAGDRDVFQWLAEESSATISTYSWNGALQYSVAIYDSARNLIARSRVNGADNSWGFANLSIGTNVGETYYVAIAGLNNDTGEYVLNVRQATSIRPEDGPVADSEFGADPHANAAGEDSTRLIPDESHNSSVSSFVDSVGDVDAFQFTGTGGIAFAIAMKLDWVGDVSLRVLDAERNEIEPGSETDGDPFGFTGGERIRMWTTEADAIYYLEIAGRDGFSGQYSLNLFTEPATEDALFTDGVTVDVPRKINELIAGLPDGPNADDRTGNFGDANFDGRVDGLDYRVWNHNKFTLVAGPENGDFNNDGAVDGSDFNIWATNRFQTASAAALNDAVTRGGRPPREASPATEAADEVSPETANTIPSPSQRMAANASSRAERFNHHVARDKVDFRSNESAETTTLTRLNSGLVKRRSLPKTSRTSLSHEDTSQSNCELIDGLFTDVDSIL